MLIFNQEEVENSFKDKDNEIIKIESRLSLKEFVQKLQNGLTGKDDQLSPDDYELHIFRSGTGREVAYVKTEDTFDEYQYTYTRDGEDERGLDEIAHERAYLYTEFEKFTYGQSHDFSEIPFDKENLDGNEYSMSELYKDCLDACGVMPTLHDALDIPIKQLQDMSYMGQNLYFSWETIQKSNRIPTREDLELFYSLSPYERAVIVDSRHNPVHLLDTIEALRRTQGYNKAFISKDFVSTLVNANRDRQIYTAEQFISAYTNHDTSDASYTALDDAFKAKFRRSPRVLPEIYDAFRDYFGVSSLSAEQIAKIVDNFNLASMSKIAPLHSPALLLLSNKMNLNTVKDEHLQIFATYTTPNDIRNMENAGFFEWYDKYKSVIKTSELCNIVRGYEALHFDINLPPKELLRLDSQIRGWCNAACVYEQYGIDFRNAVVAIPGRGLVVEDKVQKVRMYILDRDDARVFTVGQDCHCCQNLAIAGDQTYGEYYSGAITKDLLGKHFTNINDIYDYVHENYSDNHYLITPGAGGSCVANELTNPFVWVTVWEDTATGKTVAQADTHYIPDSNSLVYDNIEFVNDGNVKKLYDIIATYAEASSFDSIHVGTGYNQGMKSFGKRISTREMIKYTDDITPEYKEKFSNSLYSDYHSDAVKIKQNKELLIFSKKPMSSFKIEHRPEDNEQFRALLHPLSRIFPAYTVAQKNDLIARYDAQNITEEEMQTIAKANPELLKDFEVLSLPAQRIILFPTSEDKINYDNFKYIKNPDSLLITRCIEEKPSNIMYFDMANVSRENWENVLEKDGSLIEWCPKEYLTEEIVLKAIKNNPFSIKYVADKLDEPLRSKMIRMAVFKKPILSAHFPDIPEYVWVSICESKGQFGKYCPNQTYRVQEAMIKSSVYNIDNIRNPDKRILDMVAEKIPGIKYNPRYAAYFNGNYAQGHRSNRVERSEAPQRSYNSQPQQREESHNIFDGEEFDFSMEDFA
jgi:hypothetical protein